jgi:hypothetical protein
MQRDCLISVPRPQQATQWVALGGERLLLHRERARRSSLAASLVNILIYVLNLVTWRGSEEQV